MATVTRNDAHEYFLDGGPPLRSVTTIIAAAVGKSEMLASVRREAIEYVLEHAGHGLTADQLEAGVTRWALRHADRGTAVHEAIEWDIKGILADGGSVGTTIAEVAQARRFTRDYGLRWLAAELPVVNAIAGYGGTLDALGEVIETGEVVLVDWKTGKRAWPEHKLQLTALAYCDGLPHVERGYVVNVSEDDYKVLEVPFGVDTYDAFLAAQRVDRWLQAQ